MQKKYFFAYALANFFIRNVLKLCELINYKCMLQLFLYSNLFSFSTLSFTMM